MPLLSRTFAVTQAKVTLMHIPSASSSRRETRVKKKKLLWKPPRGAEITSCRQEFLDCAWDQSANSCVASHRQEAAALRVGPYREKDESCTDNLPHHHHHPGDKGMNTHWGLHLERCGAKKTHKKNRRRYFEQDSWRLLICFDVVLCVCAQNSRVSACRRSKCQRERERSALPLLCGCYKSKHAMVGQKAVIARANLHRPPLKQHCARAPVCLRARAPVCVCVCVYSPP